jgi:predicted TIM-barrel fold metal-dependent hydrolase
VTSVLAPAIVDSHLHLWNGGVLAYGWLDGLGIDGPYEPGDIPADVGAVPIEGFVFVQAECDPEQSVDEVNWVNDVSSGGDPFRLAGIVARVDLTSDRVAADLSEIARLDNVVGIRHNIQGEPRGFARSLVDGVDALTAMDLTFDLCCRADELDEVIDLVDRCDNRTRFVLDHLGKPAVGDPDGFDAWSSRLGRLAEASNVFCKLSGLQTETVPGVTPSADVFAPYLDRAIEAFGIDRVMYGSDWPVCTLNGSMGQWIRTVAALLGPDAAAHRKVFHDTVERFYRVSPGRATSTLP